MSIDKKILRAAAQEEIMLRSVSDTSDAWQDEANPATVLALLDELEAADAVNKHLELAIRKAEGCSEALRRRAEAAENHLEKVRGYNVDLAEESRQYQQRVAELEAREVKMPELKMLRDYLAEVTHREREDILLGVKLEFHRALQAAGIITKVGE